MLGLVLLHHNMFFAYLKTTEDRRPIGCFLLALAEPLAGMGGPFGPWTENSCKRGANEAPIVPLARTALS